ncbi:MAG: hypothetical protein J5I98_28015 [Phaeodactylibacter sp.]|nr:hypothetical protein [Phaeodactylibacter sp.]
MHTQVLVNESWSSAFGSPSEIGWSNSEVGENGNIYTVGHDQVGGRIQFLLSSHDSEGNLLWASSLETQPVRQLWHGYHIGRAREYLLCRGGGRPWHERL